MSEEFTMGAVATCTDGICGEVRRTILDPDAGTVTHLVVEPRHRTGSGRLVPIELVDSTAGEIRLRCTLAEFSELDPAEEIEFTDDGGYSGYSGPTVPASGFGSVGGFGMSGTGPGVGPGHPLVVNHAVPLGEAEVDRHERVHAVDGEIGQVEGFVVNRADNTVTHVLLKEGHLWGRKEVAIPVDAIASVADGIRLKITKRQVEDLPPLSVDGL
jgi:sporulation protein YlmC with PRC-barrel domain